MELTTKMLAKDFSEALKQVLNMGYEFYPIKTKEESGVAFTKNNKYFILTYRKINRELANREDLTLSEIVNPLEIKCIERGELFLFRDSDREPIVKKLFKTYYYVVFEAETYHDDYVKRTYDSQIEADLIVKKRNERRAWHEYEKKNVVNVFKLSKTNWKGFRRNVTVTSTVNNYILTNENGKVVCISKRYGGYGQNRLIKV